MRANMMLETLQTNRGRFQVRERDRYWLLNRPKDVPPHGSRRVWAPHSDRLLPRPYFFNQQPVPPEATTHVKNRALTKKALGRSAGQQQHNAGLEDAFIIPNSPRPGGANA